MGIKHFYDFRFKNITQFYTRKGKKQGHEYTTNNNTPPYAIPLLDPSLLFLSQKQFALHFAGYTDGLNKEGGQADIYNIGLTEL